MEDLEADQSNVVDISEADEKATSSSKENDESKLNITNHSFGCISQEAEKISMNLSFGNTTNSLVQEMAETENFNKESFSPHCLQPNRTEQLLHIIKNAQEAVTNADGGFRHFDTSLFNFPSSQPATFDSREDLSKIDKVVLISKKGEKTPPACKLKIGFIGLNDYLVANAIALSRTKHKVTFGLRFDEVNSKEEPFVSYVERMRDAQVSLSSIKFVLAECSLIFFGPGDGQCPDEFYQTFLYQYLRSVRKNTGVVDTGLYSNPEYINMARHYVHSKKGLYLYMATLGSRAEVTSTDCTQIVDGDRRLFDACTSCFRAMSRKCIYLVDSDKAWYYRAVADSLRAAQAVALGEALKMCEQTGVRGEHLCKILNQLGFKFTLDISAHEALRHSEDERKALFPVNEAYNALRVFSLLSDKKSTTAPTIEAAKELIKLSAGNHLLDVLTVPKNDGNGQL